VRVPRLKGWAAVLVVFIANWRKMSSACVLPMDRETVNMVNAREMRTVKSYILQSFRPTYRVKSMDYFDETQDVSNGAR